MTTANTTFSIVANTVSQSDVQPNIGANTGGNGFNYPTYVPVQTPSPIPTKNARITNVSMPSIVLPSSTLNIIVSFQTFLATTANYVVHIDIPQLSLSHSSNPVTLSNLARGSVILTVSLPLQGHEQAEGTKGIITGQIDLMNTTTNETVDGTPISFRVQSPGEQQEGENHHVGIPPSIILPPPVLGGAIGDSDESGGTVVILATPPPLPTGGDLDIDVHGFEPNEDIDLDFDIPMISKHFANQLKADILGHFKHTFKISKPAEKRYVASIKVHGRHSNKKHSKNLDI